MRQASPAVLAAIVAGIATMTICAGAQSVPMPRPSPQTKIGAAEPPRPPLSLGTPPLPNPVPPARTQDLPTSNSAAVAFDAKQRGLVDKVSAYLTGIQTLTGDFVQVAANGNRTEGKFYLQKPGKVRFEYDPPSPLELIADGTTIAVRDRKLATQEYVPLSQTPLRFLVADRIDLLKETNVVGVYADDLFVTLVIEENQAIGTSRLMLMVGVQDFQLRQWTVTDPQGYDTTVAVYNLDKTKKIDPGLFKINFERMLQ